MLNFRLGGWQGYQDTDFTAIVDLGSPMEISSIGAGFLQDAKSWIWLPKYAEYSISADGVNFDTLGIVYNGMEENDLTPRILDFVFTPDSKNGKKVARYIKVFAKNIGTIPAWHDGAGGEGFIFIDEIFVR